MFITMDEWHNGKGEEYQNKLRMEIEKAIAIKNSEYVVAARITMPSWAYHNNRYFTNTSQVAVTLYWANEVNDDIRRDTSSIQTLHDKELSKFLLFVMSDREKVVSESENNVVEILYK
jgi:hypothetical protein